MYHVFRIPNNKICNGLWLWIWHVNNFYIDWGHVMNWKYWWKHTSNWHVDALPCCWQHLIKLCVCWVPVKVELVKHHISDTINQLSLHYTTWWAWFISSFCHWVNKLFLSLFSQQHFQTFSSVLLELLRELLKEFLDDEASAVVSRDMPSILVIARYFDFAPFEGSCKV